MKLSPERDHIIVPIKIKMGPVSILFRDDTAKCRVHFDSEIRE